MSVTVKTFARLAEAAGALSSERNAHFLGGGTLLIRAVNEADPSVATIVRSTDPIFAHIAASSGRVELGAGVTMAAILAERELAFLHPVARAVGGPAIREAATVGGNLFAPTPYGDFATALLALEATVTLAGGFGQREVPLDEFLLRRERESALVASVVFKRPPDGRVPVCQSHARASQRHFGALDRRAAAGDERPRDRRADRLRRHGADAGAGQGGGAGARRPFARRRRRRSGARGRRRRHLAGRRRHRQRLVAARNPSRSFAPAARRRGAGMRRG